MLRDELQIIVRRRLVLGPQQRRFHRGIVVKHDEVVRLLALGQAKEEEALLAAARFA